jgi:hypothetical protein
VSKLLGVAFGHSDLRTLLCQTSFSADFLKKDFIPITREAWRNRDITEQNVTSIDPKTLRDLALSALGRRTFVFGNWLTFSAPAVNLFCKFFLTNSVVPEPEGSSPHLQQPTNGPYPEPS